VNQRGFCFAICNFCFNRNKYFWIFGHIRSAVSKLFFHINWQFMLRCTRLERLFKGRAQGLHSQHFIFFVAYKCAQWARVFHCKFQCYETHWLMWPIRKLQSKWSVVNKVSGPVSSDKHQQDWYEVQELRQSESERPWLKLWDNVIENTLAYCTKLLHYRHWYIENLLRALCQWVALANVFDQKTLAYFIAVLIID
jgi:hypothetical protein